MDDFSNYPKSLGERRADENKGNAAKWTPRDAVISFLRDLDAGAIKSDAVVIVYTSYDGDGATTTGYRMAGPNLIHTLGMLEYAKMRVTRDAS